MFKNLNLARYSRLDCNEKCLCKLNKLTHRRFIRKIKFSQFNDA